jgi:FBP C-terminal treble-clef zinc-finger
MRSVTEPEIRTSFVNCSRGEARRANLPRGLADTDWDQLEFLGWQDPAAPGRAYLVATHADPTVAIALRYQAGKRPGGRRQMCSLCLTTHPGDGVALMVAPRGGAAGRRGDTVGLYICRDLACSEYTHGTRTPALATQAHETLTIEEKTERLRTRLDEFLDRVREE